MIALHQAMGFALAAFIIIIVPGPSVLFIVSRGVSLGRRAGGATAFGNNLGTFTQGLLVAFGLGAVVARSIAIFTAVKFIGAIYLVWLGYAAVRDREALAGALDTTVEIKPIRRIVREGWVVGLSNPKVIIFFSAILPQFIVRSRGHVPLQMLQLLGIFFVIGIVCDSTWGMLAGTVRNWFRQSPKRLETMVGAGGLSIMGLGVRLALTGRHD